MEPNELRIGNLILIEAGIDLPRPHRILAEDIADFAAGNIAQDRIRPIPVTPEILVKCGFKNKSGASDYYFDNGEMIIGGHQKGLYPSVQGESGLEAYGIEVKYLHQLQNLHLAITGKEITVNV